MYCMPRYVKKRIFYRCLCSILIIGLLCQLHSFLEGAERWEETLLLRQRGRCRLRRRRSQVVWPIAVRRRGYALLCRSGLIAVLLLWSGWPRRQAISWVVLGLPVVDFLLSLLPLGWPDVSKVRVYPRLIRWTHDLYRLSIAILFCEAVLPGRNNYYLCCAGACVRSADGAWAEGRIEEDGAWYLEMEGHIIFTYQPHDETEKRILLTLFRQIRTPQGSPKRPFLRQEWLAEWFNTHQELISRWQRYVREGGLNKLNGESDGWIVTPEIQQAILDIWVPNFWLSAAQVCERLLAADHIASLDDISETSIYRVAEETGFAEVRRLLRQMFTLSLIHI